MTLAELQAACEDMANEHPELLNCEVFSTYNYGDYGRTQAMQRFECLTLAAARESYYSSSGLAVTAPGKGDLHLVLGMYPASDYEFDERDDD